MILLTQYNSTINNANGAIIMNNQVKLFAANMVLAAAAFLTVAVAHAAPAVPAQGHSVQSAVVQYLANVGEQVSQASHAAR